MSTRLKGNMNIDNLFFAMTEDNPGATECLIKILLSDEMSILDVLALDTYGIYGEEMYKLWNDSCNRSLKKLKSTIREFRAGKFTKEQIHENLSQTRAKPFI